MNEVLAALKASTGSGMPFQGTRVLTDISGNNFTLVLEMKAESLDAYMQALQAMFQMPDQAGVGDVFDQYIESGSREFYTIEFDASS
jgi:hypothetical protein